MGKVDIRSCIIAPEGRVLVAADFSGQELRVLSHVAREPTMIQAFLNNMDVHLATANKFYGLGIPEECLITTHPEHEAIKAKYKEERDSAKIVNFSISYGKTHHGFAKDWGWPLDKAEKFINDYFKQFPKIKEMIDKCHALVKQQKAIRSMTGRIRRFDFVDNRALRQAVNYIIQSPSADMMKKAAVDIRTLCLQRPEWGAKLVLSVHDELVYEVNEEHADIVIAEVKYAMEHCLDGIVKLRVPPVADVKKGKTYADAK